MFQIVIDFYINYTCQQLSQNDCVKNNVCSWNKTCDVRTITQSKLNTYCSYLEEKQCQQDDACQWVNSQCSFFTGCTPYKLTSDRECKSLNKRCYKSDLKKCVELKECIEYTDPIVCFMDVNYRYCYWDTKMNKCSRALDCLSQPSALDTDAECRSQIVTCTTKPGGGCIDAQQSCNDIKLEIQCYYNKDQSSKCFWDSSLNPPMCIIQNNIILFINLKFVKMLLSLSLQMNNADYIQKNVLLNQMEVVSQDQHVMQLLLKMLVYKIFLEMIVFGQMAIVNKNYVVMLPKILFQMQDVNLLQNNFNQIVKINKFIYNLIQYECLSICSKDCITKSGGGCMTNGECSIANVDYACKQNLRGEQCFWDSITQLCKDRTCIVGLNKLKFFRIVWSEIIYLFISGL